MPDLLASLQINVPLPGLVPVVPLRAAPVAAPGRIEVAPDFAAALSDLLIPGAAPKAKSERQAAAEDGKELPVAVESADPLIAWLPDGSVPVALPAIVSIADPALVTPSGAAIHSDDQSTPSMPQASPVRPFELLLPTATSETVQREAPAATPPPVAMPTAVQPAALTRGDALPSNIASPIVIEVAASPSDAPIETPAGPSEPEDLAAMRSRFDAPLRDTARAAMPPTVTLQPASLPVAVTTGAAAQVFATALTAPPLDAAPLDRAGDAAIVLHGQARTEQLTTVQAMSGSAQPTLDMTRDDWTGQMIERIAAMQDAAEAVDTRIKLAPENLGALEVSIRRDGDRIHVHFTADNPAARQLIADAAPRLAELADARGVKLGQTSVDGGSQQPGGQRGAQQQPSQTTARNTSVASQSEPITDQRIA